LALLSGTQGIVTLHCEVGKDGSLRPKTSEGPRVLADAAKANATRWRFSVPDSDEAKSMVIIVYTFEIKGATRKTGPETTFAFEFPNRVQVSSPQPYLMPKAAKR